MAAETHNHTRVSATYQGIAFLIAFACLFTVFYIRNRVFITHDPYLPLMPYETNHQSVTMGLHISHFSAFDIPKNQFILDGIIWFLFDPQQVSLDTIKKFNVFNGTLHDISDPVIIDYHDKKAAQFRIRAEFHTPLNYRMFPIDDHRVNLIIINRFLPKTMAINSAVQNITFDESMYVPGWHIINYAVRTGIKKVVLEQGTQPYTDQQQEAIITFNCERIDPSIIINILLTLFLMLFLAMLTFSSDEDSVLIVTVGIVALISYRTVMQTMAPPQVSYFMYADYLYLFTLISVIITLFGGIITRDRNMSVTHKKYYIAGVYALFIIASAITSFLL